MLKGDIIYTSMHYIVRDWDGVTLAAFKAVDEANAYVTLKGLNGHVSIVQRDGTYHY